MPRRKRLELDERRAQLVALGLEVFSERSYDEVAIDEVAQRAGISKGLLYHYFRSKRDFYVATVEHAAGELTRYITPSPELGPIAQVQQGVERYLRYVESKRASYVSLMRSGVGADPEVDAVVERVREQIIGLVLQRTKPAGDTRARRMAVRGWIGFVEAASLDWLRHGGVDRRQLQSLCVQVLLQSLASSVQATVSEEKPGEPAH